jgi:phosphatidylinositol-3,4,5-trisphosphate 3-phosphatase and dual-specificity protein phosphatase PTEN
MISCYLVFAGLCKTAHEALVYYGKMRTRNEKGVTIPSQIRYVYYFDHFMRHRRKIANPMFSVSTPPVVQKIFKIRMVTIPSFEKGGFTPNFTVSCKGHIFYDYNKQEKPEVTFLRSISYHDFFIYQQDDKEERELLVYDDVKIQFYHNGTKVFHFWFNTWFVDKEGFLFLNKEMIDKACSDTKHLKYDKNFSIKVFMTKIDSFKMEQQQLKRDSKPKLNSKESKQKNAEQL